MTDRCERCGGSKRKPPDGWKTDIPGDTWEFWRPILYAILPVAVGVAIVSARPSVIGWPPRNATNASNWAQVFIMALAGIAAGIAGLTAIGHVEQAHLTNQLNALTHVWETVNKKEITESRRKLYKTLTTNQRYKDPKKWSKDLESLVEPVANPLDFAGWMVIKGLLSRAVVALAYGEVFIRTYAVLQHWIEQERDDHRPKEFKKGLEAVALWAAVNDQNCRESFNYGHRVEFAFGHGMKTKAEKPICIWETIAPTCSAAG